MANRVGIRGRVVDLYVKLVDQLGRPVTADVPPLVQIYDSAGNVQQIATNLGVGSVDGVNHDHDHDHEVTQGPDNAKGVYVLHYNIPLNAPDGYWSDVWTAYVGGMPTQSDAYVSGAFTFYVTSAGALSEGDKPINYPGDELPWHFNEDETLAINILLKMVKARLKNDGYREVMINGCYVQQPCTVFTNDELITFLVNSLSSFNQIPHFTRFTFDDPAIHVIYADVIVQGAVLLALAAQALIEKGREFVINDNGVTYQPPQISEILNSQYGTQLTNYTEKLKQIKCNLKPHPLGLGTFRVTSVSPNFLRLRHLRERQII